MEQLNKEEMLARWQKKADEREKYIKSLPKCPKCHNPMQETPCETCIADKIEQEASRKRDILRLGGIKAFQEFTPLRFKNKALMEECNIQYPDKNLFLWGKAGTGKSHLATAIIRNYPKGIVYKPQAIMRECRFKKPIGEQGAIDKFVNMPYLVIDDLGVDKKTDFSFSILYEILEGRMMNYKNGMIITSNLDIDGLAERLGDDRLTSRIVGMAEILEVAGKDFRYEKKED